ncbi:SdrD B-like domain-containing protein [Halioxenophilus aromaticivorans]|uniref:SdrD B-like domain-containing protein n=1 Tax=Halioxenophilus aromaticivorans TaxID=1306992 RepID=UPI0031E6FFF7
MTKQAIFRLGLAGLLCSTGAVAKEPISFSSAQVTGKTQTTRLPGLDNAKLKQRDAAARAKQPKSYVLQFAEPQSVAVKPNAWQEVQVPNGSKAIAMSVWRTEVKSPGAFSLNFGFSRYQMPEGGSLHIYTPDRKQRIRAFTAADNDIHGELWTPMLTGDTAIIEVNVPTSKLKQLKLELASVNHGYVAASMAELAREKSGNCNVDVVCPVGDEWRDQIRSAAAISINGSLFCSGGALNNTANDGTGFFLTAHHCGIDESNAASMVTYWNYENSVCREPGSVASGDLGDGVLDQFNTGAIFRASYEPSDMTLMELDDPLDPAHNVFLAGWNANDQMPSSSVAIHHPNLNEKRISFDHDTTTITSYLNPASPGDGTHIQVADWDLGTTEPGSSGSLLFDQNKRVIGQLHGGDAACGNDMADWYGRIYTSWDGGGTVDTRLSSWLDANGTGELAIDGINATDLGTNRLPVVKLNGPYYGVSGMPVDFSSAGSQDLDGSIISFDWGFGDGNAAFSAANPQHTYAQGGTYDVSLRATDNDGGSRIVYTQATILEAGEDELENGIVKSGISAEIDQAVYYYLNVPEGVAELDFTSDGQSGDADMYVSRGSTPTTTVYDCRSWASGSQEMCSFTDPEAGTYIVMLYGYNTFTGVSLTGSYKQATGGTGALGDLVWSDTNGNGVQDTDEPGLADVTVELQSCEGVVLATQITDSNGLFNFTELGTNDAQLKFVLPAGYEFSPERATDQFQLDSNANPTTGLSPCYNMSQGFRRSAVDAGMVPSQSQGGEGVMGDFVWQDNNGDGVQDADEPGLAGVTVNLQACDGTAVDSVVTNSQGGFSFDSVATGSYRLEFVLLDGYSFSPEKATNEFLRDSNANTTSGLTGCYNMDNGNQRRAIDAGMVPEGTGSNADNLSVVNAIYFSASKRLWVRAESDTQPVGSASITASVTINGATSSLGAVGWKADKGFYQNNFRDVDQLPSLVTLASDKGGLVRVAVEVR